MSAAAVESPVERTAWQAYRQAFHNFSDGVRRLQSLLECPNSDASAIESALVEVEKARVIYNKHRDVVAQQMLPVNRRTNQVPAGEYTEHIRDIAELLWETAGRPEGTAEKDWLKAEQIVKLALAAAA